jgi:hypothetical protein
LGDHHDERLACAVVLALAHRNVLPDRAGTVNPLIIEALVEVGAELMHSASDFLDLARSEGCASFQDVEEWMAERDEDMNALRIHHLQLAWEMGL